MSEQGNVNSSAIGGASNPAAAVPGKDKGKVVDPPQDVSMDEDDDSSDTGAEEEPLDDEVEEPDEDNMEEIDTDNIINDGRRTRGLVVDFVEANKNAGDELDDDDEDEDDDFLEEDEAMEG